MVFAVWAARREIDPSRACSSIDRALAAALADAHANAADVARDASVRYAYPAGYLARYFERLRYRFGTRERQGLAPLLHDSPTARRARRGPRPALRRPAQVMR